MEASRALQGADSCARLPMISDTIQRGIGARAGMGPTSYFFIPRLMLRCSSLQLVITLKLLVP